METHPSAAQASAKGTSIVEISERCQDPKAAGVNIRPSSPRTVEAFLRSGFDPEDLVYKPLSYFKEKTLSLIHISEPTRPY